MNEEIETPEAQAAAMKALPEGTLHATVGVQWIPFLGQFIATDADLFYRQMDPRIFFGFWIVPVETGGVELVATDGHSLVCIFEPKGRANLPLFVRPTPELLRACKPDTDVVPTDVNGDEDPTVDAIPKYLVIHVSRSIAHPEKVDFKHVYVGSNSPDHGFFSQFLSDPQCSHCGDKSFRESLVHVEEQICPVPYRNLLASPAVPTTELVLDARLLQRVGYLMRYHPSDVVPMKITLHGSDRSVVLSHETVDGTVVRVALMPMDLSKALPAPPTVSPVEPTTITEGTARQ